MKKRCLSILMVLSIVLSILPIETFAANNTDVTYAVDGGNIHFDTTTGTITDCDSRVTDANIPNTIEGVKVEHIGDNAFNQCFYLKSITIPESITTIGKDAFSLSDSLISIVIPDSVISIGTQAFYNCTSLESVVLSSSLTSVEPFTFSGCKRLKIVEVPNRVTSIGKSAFDRCEALTNIEIPASVVQIDNGAFMHCSNLTNVILPQNLSAIADFTFYGCSSLTNMVIPKNVLSIGGDAFGGCSGLEQINIPDGVVSIGSSAFYGCSSLKSIDIPDSVTSLGNAFSNCSSLTSVTIPASLYSQVFLNCSAITHVRLTGTKAMYDYGGSYEISKPWMDCTSDVTIEIENSVPHIGNYAFYRCDKLIEITLPNSVTSIGKAAFKDCVALKKVVIPSSVKSLEHDVFSGCVELKTAGPIGGGYSYEFGWTTEIPDNAFSGCSGLTRVTIPASVTNIGQNAFSGCSGLTDVYYGDSKESWALISGEGKPSDGTVTIHYNSTGPGDVGPDNMNPVYFLSGWDATTRTVQFGDTTLVSPDTYTVADSVDVSNIDSLLNKYVLVSMEQGNSSLEYTITDIQPVESKIGTVSATGEHSLTIDGITYPVREDYLLGAHSGQEFLYHISNGTIMGFDILEEKTGTLEAWDSATGKVTIDSKVYPSNYMSDLSYLKNLDVSSHPKVEYAVANGIDYQPVLRLMVSSYETKVGTFTQYDSATNTAHIDGQGYPVDTSSCNLGSNNFNGKQVFFLLKNGKIIHMDATGNVKSALRVTLSPQKVNVTYKDNKLSANEFDVGVTVSHSYSYAFPDHYDRSIIYAAAGLQPIKLNTVAWEGDKLSFSNTDLSGVTLAVGENQSGTVKVAIDKKYVLVSDSETLVATCTVTGVPGGSGQTLEAQQTVSIQIKKDGSQTENPDVPVETPESATWKNTLLKTFYQAEDIRVTSTPGSLLLRKYFDKDVVDDIGKAVAVWETAMRSPLASETSGRLPKYLKITYPMNDKKGGHSASIWFCLKDGMIDKTWASFGEGIHFVLIDNVTGAKLEDTDYSIKLSASAKTFADGMDLYLQKSCGDDMVDFAKKLAKDTVIATAKDFASVSGKEYIDFMVGILKDFKTIADTAKKVTGYTEKVQSILSNPIEVVSASTKDFDDCCKRVRAKCPVDVYVYNPTGILCGSIVDNEIDVDTFEVFMDVSGSEKTVWLHDNYTIKLIATGDGSMEYSITEYSEEAKKRTVLFNAVPLSSGLVYDGNIPKELDVDASDYALTSDTGDIVYADNIITYENVFRIFFDANGGTIQNPTMPTETTGKLLNLPIPARTGYTFDGWFTSASGGNKITTDYVFTSDTTVYAHWTKNGGNSSGGSSSSGSSSDGGSSSTRYSITAGNFTHGSVSTSPKSASKGTKVTLTIQPDNDYKLEELAVIDSKGNKLELTDKGNGKYTFIMPAGSVKVEANFTALETSGMPWINPFADVAENAWYCSAVRFVNENGLMGGYGNGLFGVNDNLSRAQLAQILYNKEGRSFANEGNNFTDVDTTAWYADAVTWAAAQGIVSGYGNGMFGPNDPITREQLAVMLWRYSGSPVATNKELHFNDADEVSGFALEAMRWAVEHGIVNGYGDGRLGPKGLATRAQVAQILKNYLEL